MAAAIQARAGKNVGPFLNATSLVGQKSYVKKLVVGNNTLEGIAPDSNEGKVYRTLNPLGLPTIGGAPPESFLTFKNKGTVDVTVQVTYKINGVPFVLYAGGAAALPAARTLALAGGATVSVPLTALSIGTAIFAEDSIVVTVASAGVPDGNILCFYSVQNVNKKGLVIARKYLTVPGAPVTLFQNPVAGTTNSLGTIAGLLAAIATIGALFEIDLDSADNTITYLLTDENDVIIDAISSTAFATIGLSGQVGKAPGPLVAVWNLPAGWKIKASIATPVVSNPIVVQVQIQTVDEAPVSQLGAGAF